MKFRVFIQLDSALINLRILLPINDTVISKIYAFDPDCGTANQDLTDLAAQFDNIILPRQYHEFYKEVSGWIFDNIKLINLRKQYKLIPKILMQSNFIRINQLRQAIL